MNHQQNKMADEAEHKSENTADFGSDEKVIETETNLSEEFNEIEAKDDRKEENASDDELENDHLMVYETADGLTILDSVPACSCHHGHDSNHDAESPRDETIPEDSDGIPVDSSISEELIMNLEKMRREEVVDLPETVTKLTTADGCIVYLVGTAHFSKESQDDVAKTIQAVKPDVVVVELCKSRVDILKHDEEYLLREAKNIDVQKLKFAIKQSGVVGGLMQVLLLSMSAHITKQLGMAPGGEFRTAYNEARKIPGCQIHLGDRPIQITLSRAMGALSVWQKMKLAWHLLTTKQAISKEDVERCKQKDLLAEMLAEMTGDFPLLYKVFVSERDRYLARSLRLSSMPIAVHNQEGEFQGVIPSVVVGVVGIGHTAGIADNFDKEIDVQDLLKVPGPSKTGRLIKLSLKALVGVILAWGSYKIFKWTNIGNYLQW
ncbi:traB domain-containing protein [Exaiptasia diaphana]|uniref:TraB domain-containing protein n=1 Tax=Exaiptasia diaphana TaxID=2652724 RepID=A0A913XBH4_EXADI|nr:traB domain-containing protein [Exaiptasia diaphana]KXJ26500.1 TraB domain-containing protein [Exaiptasia diaphana]